MVKDEGRVGRIAGKRREKVWLVVRRCGLSTDGCLRNGRKKGRHKRDEEAGARVIQILCELNSSAGFLPLSGRC